MNENFINLFFNFLFEILNKLNNKIIWWNLNEYNVNNESLKIQQIYNNIIFLRVITFYQ